MQYHNTTQYISDELNNEFFDGLSIKITPDSTGSSISEIYLLITYDTVPTAGLIKLEEGFVFLEKGKIVLG